MIKINSKIKFIVENNFGLFCVEKILELAIIINAEIRILKMIRVADIVSIAENVVIENVELERLIKLNDRRVIKNNEPIVNHQ